MKKFLDFLDRAETLAEETFMIFVVCALVVAVLTGCDCDCGPKGTLMLRDGNGGYSYVCHCRYYAVNHNPRFRCDDGREILNPTNFIVEK